MKRPVPCPHCGELIPAASIACRHCGSDRATGWATDEEISYRSVEIPESWPEEPVRPRVSRFGRALVLILVLAGLLAWLVLAGL